jgi:hypothetical protein
LSLIASPNFALALQTRAILTNTAPGRLRTHFLRETVIFEQFYMGCPHASYLIGSGDVAAVVDPQRDVQVYHADFVSGHLELAGRTPRRLAGRNRRVDRRQPTARQESSGFTHILNMAGGLDAWTAAGLPL